MQFHILTRSNWGGLVVRIDAQQDVLLDMKAACAPQEEYMRL